MLCCADFRFPEEDEDAGDVHGRRCGGDVGCRRREVQHAQGPPRQPGISYFHIFDFDFDFDLISIWIWIKFDGLEAKQPV